MNIEQVSQLPITVLNKSLAWLLFASVVKPILNIALHSHCSKGR